MDEAERFGQYELVELVGQGGVGEVWKATDTEHRRTVALKRLLPRYAQDGDYHGRFLREAELTSKLQQAHVLPIHRFGEIEGRLYIEMPWVNGTDLASRLAENGPMSTEDAVRVVEQVAEALDTAHGHDLVHRDVKPSNVMLGKDGSAYLIDFGISRSIADTGQTSTEDGIAGTLPYIAPERFDRGHRSRDDGPPVDVYSLACLLFELITGKRAYPNGNRDMGGGQRPPFPRISTVRPDVPETFGKVMSDGLAIEPHKRPASARALAALARKALVDAEKQAEDKDRAKAVRNSAARGAHEGQEAKTREQDTATKSSTAGMPGSGTRDHSTVRDAWTRRETEGAHSTAPPPRTAKEWPHPAGQSPNRSGPAARIAGAAVIVMLVAGVVWWLSGDSADRGIAVGGTPSAIALDRDGKTALVTNSGTATVSFVDTTSRQVIDSVPVGDAPNAIAVNDSTRRAYIANQDSGTVSVIDIAARKVLTTIPVGDTPSAVVLQPGGRRAYVANTVSEDVSVIDTVRNTVVATIDVASDWDAINGLAVSADGSRLLVARAGSFSDSVDVIDVANEDVVGSIEVGAAPEGVAISRDGRRAYVASHDAGTVSVIDVGGRAVTTAIPVGSGPTGVVLSPDGKRAFVTGDPALPTIDTSTNRLVSAPAEAQPATALAISQDGQRGYLVDADSGTMIPIGMD